MIDADQAAYLQARHVVIAHMHGPCPTCTADGCPDAQAALAYVIARRPTG